MNCSPSRAVFFGALLVLLATAACSGPTRRVSHTTPPPMSRNGAVNEDIRYGQALFDDTRNYLKADVTAQMSCSACHIAGGTVARGGSLIGVYARFPRWNNRAHRVITLQDRIAECFLYSMNGTPPSFSSREMVSLVAYMAQLSRGVPVGQPRSAARAFAVALPAAPPNVAHGAALYAQKCSKCHQANGAGINGRFPPLWGKTSFNSGAGMAHVAKMTGFVRYNMPKNAPGSLTLDDAYDISAYVLSHARPHFNARRMIGFPAKPASYF